MSVPMTASVDRCDTLSEYLDAYAASRPSEDAAVEGTMALTYAELKSAVDSLTAAMRAAGVEPGDRLAFMGSPGLAFWVSLLASHQARAVWVGLNPQHTEREMVHVLSDSQPVLVLVSARINESVRGVVNQAATAAGLRAPVILRSSHGETRWDFGDSATRARPEDMTSVALAQAGVCLIVYTSGTTGHPKGALITFGGLVENGWWMAKRAGFNTGRTLANLPVNHIGCVGDVCAACLVAGGTLVFMERFSARRAIALLREQRIAWLPQVPAQLQLMMSEGLSAKDLETVRRIAWGGAAMPRPLIAKLLELGPDLYNSYGLTECSGTITVSEPGASLDELALTVGKPVDAALLRIADERGLPVRAGEEGEVQIRGQHLFHGYLHEPSASADALTTDGWLHTGDVGTQDSQGNVRLVGRRSDMFKSGGYNVYPREVESVIESLAGVELCAVISVPDPLWGEVGIAFVQGDPDVVAALALEGHCAERLARYKVPKRFVVRGKLPLLPIGKIDKRMLKAQELARSTSTP